MNQLLVIILALLAALCLVALATRSAILRAGIVALILLSSSGLFFAHNRAEVHRQYSQAKDAGLAHCEEVWRSAQLAAQERLYGDALILFATNAALAIIAAIPKRREGNAGMGASRRS